ncbi:putative dsRNA-binding protein [Lacrimispora celerecrescens]|uniref:putative dsRNA-binding protein n=1 Tax=Lacrimispora celerecrescens TaxID=29354 RepID=UPI001645B87A|nr:putative dsRNA-binding protein [Lacrimispora celerecrescens]
MNCYELYQVLGLKLNPDEIDEILYHASFQPQTSSLLKRNKEYFSWGNTIISVIMTVYLYDSGTAREASELSARSSRCYKEISEAIYKQYDLEKYEYVSKGEKDNEHPDIASKLVALIYKTNGMLETYRFVLPFAIETENVSNIDYRTILQEYAQAKKIPLEYKIIDQKGSDHEPQFTCQLTVGNKVLLVNGKSKKDSYRLAAEKFIKDNKIIVTSKKQSKEIPSVRDYIKLSHEREKQLLSEFEQISIGKETLPISCMNAAFIHKSAKNEIRGFHFVDNSAISVIGAQMYTVLAYEYIFDTYDINSVDVTKEKDVLSEAMNLEQAIPNNWLSVLIAAKSVKSLNKTGKESLKLDIYKGILGGLLLEAIASNNSRAVVCAKDITFNYMDHIKNKKVPDYITPLQEVIQETGLKEERNVEDKTGSYEDNTMLFVCTISCSDDKKIFKTVGEGTSRKKAKNKASLDMLNELLPYYQDNIKAKKIILNVLEPGKCSNKLNDIELEKDRRESVLRNDENSEDSLEEKTIDEPVEEPGEVEEPQIDFDSKLFDIWSAMNEQKEAAGNSIKLISNEIPISGYINYFGEKVGCHSAKIASGFLYKSGLKMIEPIIQRISESNEGIMELIIGSLKDYFLSSTDNKLVNIDLETAKMVNELLTKKVCNVYTLENQFYHGKYFFFEGEKESFCIVGSSNLTYSGFAGNYELNTLYYCKNETEQYTSLKLWFDSFINKCTKIDNLSECNFADTNMKFDTINAGTSIESVDLNSIENEIQSLTDEELKFRLNLWLDKKPTNIYRRLDIENLKDYVAFEFKEHKLVVFESFEAGNGYYYFHGDNIFELVQKVKDMSKTQIFELAGMEKRGYHIRDRKVLKRKIYGLFVNAEV